MAEYDLAVALDVLANADAGADLGQQRDQCGLTHLKRLAAQIVAVQLDQIESVQDDVVVTATGVKLVEQGEPRLGAEHHGLAVDRYGLHSQTRQSLTDARKAVGPT